jgi:bifunctional DNA-binding transcriptional regulator/antitoxin component of YhaV-PrlF toxin-antitoxin module
MKAKPQKQLSYKYNEKQQYKHAVVIPEEVVSKLNWKGRQELELSIRNGQLITEKSKKWGEVELTWV